MKIFDFIIPKDLQTNGFILSLHEQLEKKGKLSFKQIWALEDMLEIEYDFYGWDFVPENEEIKEDWDKLIAKLKRNRFRSNKNRNKCIRALESIIDDDPIHWLIDEALGKNYSPYRRW